MKYFDKKPAVLLLEDGTVFKGKSAGKIGTVGGEVCFNTGMTGYQEIFTDPSYYQQIMVMTNAHIGNYGTKELETESNGVKISGMVCKNFTNLFSRKNADRSIQDYFLEQNLVAISDIDTRALVTHIRDKGAMNAVISSETEDVGELKKIVEKVPSMNGLELSSKVSTKKKYFRGEPSAKYKVAVLDLGVKSSILGKLVERDCYLQVFPAKTSFKEINAWNPDGYFVSNGPGDPASTDYGVETTKKMLESNKSFFGICLGHQLFALSLGIKTYKMHNGHRGINHPVKNLVNGNCEITSQNHGFCVDEDSVRSNDQVEITHLNLNDKTVEGIKSKKYKAFSVQYHPEASPGPHDSRYLFDDFIKMMAS